MSAKLEHGRRSPQLTSAAVEELSEPRSARGGDTHVATGSFAVLYGAADFFLVRSPLEPLSRLQEWAAAANCAGDDWSRRREFLEAALQGAFDEGPLRSATFFASPRVTDLLGPVAPRAKLPPDVLRTLAGYYARAASRSTPFGAFAGVSFGCVGASDRFELEGADRYRLATRVSTQSLMRLLASLAQRPAVRADLSHRPNSTLAPVHGSARYARRSGDTVERATYGLAELTLTPAIERALELARAGITPRELAQTLAREGFDADAALTFAVSLCESEVLVPSWLPAVTGRGAFAAVSAAVAGHALLHREHTCLRETSERLARADATPIATALSEYGLARQAFLQCFPDAPFQPFQTELVKPAPGLELSGASASKLLGAAELVRRLGRPPQDPDLIAFRRHFVERYEDRWVDLAEALDADAGIGFGRNESHVSDGLLSGIPIHPAPRVAEFDAFDFARQRLLHTALSQGKYAVELTDELLAHWPQNPVEALPESFAVIAQLMRLADGALGIVAPIVMAPSAVALMGRFAEASPELDAALHRLAHTEQALAGDVLLADVAYLPEDSAANVVSRPPLRRVEIPYGGSSGAPADGQLAMSDLLVGIEGERVVLFSKSRRQRVAIRLANAHNARSPSSPTAYRFFGALQEQDATLAASWSWGLLSEAAFLPRVCRGAVVLCPARWTVRREELVARDERSSRSRLQELRVDRNLPRWVSWVEGDQHALVDLDNELSVDTLLHAARQRPSLLLEELLPTPDSLVVRGPEGAFASQFVVPFVRRAVAAPSETPEGTAASFALTRRHAPGSDWLYVKLYAARSRHSELLRAVLSSVIHAPGASVQSWFYLPYSDPDPHLRVRLQGKPSHLRGPVLRRLERSLRPLLERGDLRKWELSTYEPEIARYGGELGLRLAERVFCADSVACAALLDLSEGDEERRWQLALLGIDRSFSDAGFDLVGRAELAHAASEAYRREVGADPTTVKAIGEKYRSHAPLLADVLWREASAGSVFALASQLFEARSELVKPLWSELRDARASGLVSTPLTTLARTFAHLHATRLLGVTARAHELVLYGFLVRLYRARLARSGAEHTRRGSIL